MSKNAREISQFLGTDHKEIMINPNDYVDVINPDVRFCGILEMLHIGAISNAYKIRK